MIIKPTFFILNILKYSSFEPYFLNFFTYSIKYNPSKFNYFIYINRTIRLSYILWNEKATKEFFKIKKIIAYLLFLMNFFMN